MTQLVDKVVWITGASSGIGEALAYEAAHRGAYLVLSARRETELNRVRKACSDPSRVAVLPLDLWDFAADAAAARAAGFFGATDVLVNNAGASSRGLVTDTDVSVYRRVMELDFFAPVALTRAVLPEMIARRSGHVVMVGSVVSRVGTPKRSAYAAAKHALAGYTECARAEMHEHQLRFTLVMPGFVRTQVTVNALGTDGKPVGRDSEHNQGGIAPARCAQAVWDGVARNQDEVVVGGMETQIMRIHRLSPRLSNFLIRKVPST